MACASSSGNQLQEALAMIKTLLRNQDDLQDKIRSLREELRDSKAELVDYEYEWSADMRRSAQDHEAWYREAAEYEKEIEELKRELQQRNEMLRLVGLYHSSDDESCADE